MEGMKRLMPLIVFAVMYLFVSGTLGRTGGAASDDAVDTLFPQQNAAAQSKIDSGKSGNKLSPAADSQKIAAKRLDIIESRLGPVTRQLTPKTTIERRLADIEQRLDRLELQYNRIQQMEQRIRKMEAQRY